MVFAMIMVAVVMMMVLDLVAVLAMVAVVVVIVGAYDEVISMVGLIWCWCWRLYCDSSGAMLEVIM